MRPVRVGTIVKHLKELGIEYRNIAKKYVKEYNKLMKGVMGR